MTESEILWAIRILLGVAAMLGCFALYYKEKYRTAMEAAKWLRQQNDYFRHVIKNSDTIILQRLKDQLEAEEAYDRV